MGARRKYKHPIKLTILIEEWKMKILRDVYDDSSDTKIITVCVDNHLQLSYDNGKIKSDFIDLLIEQSESIVSKELKKQETLKAVKENRIQAEKRDTKLKTDFKKLVTTLRKGNHIEIEEGKVVISDRLRDTANEFSEQLGISISVKMLIEEIERQEASA